VALPPAVVADDPCQLLLAQQTSVRSSRWAICHPRSIFSYGDDVNSLCKWTPIRRWTRAPPRSDVDIVVNRVVESDADGHWPTMRPVCEVR